MRRRDFISFAGGAIVAWPFAAIAQQAGRTYRLGMLWPLPRDTHDPGEKITIAFLDELRRRGFIEGQNLTIEYRAFVPHPDLMSEYAAELVKAQVDVIFPTGDVAIRAAQQATKAIPILGVTDDMVGSGLVASLARPNGNTTGVSILATELDGKRQEILTEAVPGLRRMAALADSNTTAVAKLHALQEAARARNIELSIHRIARGEEIAAAIDMAQGIGRHSAQRFGVTDPLGQSSAYYGPRRSAACAGHLLISRNGGGRRLCRLRTTRHLCLSRAFCPTAREALPRHQGRRHPGRVADQVRAGDQPQDRQCAGRYGAAYITGTRRQGDRVTRQFPLRRPCYTSPYERD